MKAEGDLKMHELAILKRLLSDPRLTHEQRIVGGIMLLHSDSALVCRVNPLSVAQEAGVAPETVRQSAGLLEALQYIWPTSKECSGGDPRCMPLSSDTEFWSFAPVATRQVNAGKSTQLGVAMPKKKGFSPPLASPPLSPKNQLKKTSGTLFELDPPVSKLSSIDTIDKTSKSNRWFEMWQLLCTVRFVTPTGVKETARENVANPEEVCDYLASDKFCNLDLKDQMQKAAFFTAERQKNRRQRLGMFLRGWFEREIAYQRNNYNWFTFQRHRRS